MSEENKKVELNEEELSQVSGGHTPPENVTTSQQPFVQPSYVLTPKKEELKNQISGFMTSIINKTNQKSDD